MASVREDRVNLTVTINGDQAQKELNELDQKSTEYRETMKGLEQDIKEYETASSKLSKANYVWIESDKEVRKLRTDLEGLEKGTDDYNNKLQELQRAERAFERIDERVAKLTEETNRLKKSSEEYAAASNGLKQVEVEMTGLKEKIGLAGLNQRELNKELKTLMAIKQYTTPGTAAMTELEGKIRAVKLRQLELAQASKVTADDLKLIGASAGSMNQLESKIKTLHDQIAKLSPVSQDFINKTKEVQRLEREYASLSATVSGTGGFIKRFWSEIGSAGQAVLGYLGVQQFISQVTNLVSKNAKLSDSLADIQRVAGLTKEEVRELNKVLGETDTRTSTESLRDITIVAGKLGVAKNELAGFTTEVDKLVVTLGDELGNADAVTTSLGKILNVFEGKITADNIARLGNAFVVLANKGVATGDFMADFTQRLSGIAVAANLSLPATIGLGAGLEELGQKVESSSTAVQKLLVTVASDMPKAAKIAGAKSLKEIEEFTKLFAEKPEEALLKYAEGLVKNKAAFSEVTASFKDAGEEGARVVSTLTQLGTKSDFLRGKMNDTAEAIGNTTAFNEAFKLKNESLGAELEKLGKKIYAAFTNNVVIDFFTGAVKAGSSFIDITKSVIKIIGDYKEAILLTITAIISYRKGMELTETINKRFAKVLSADVGDALKSAENGFKSLWTTMKANPVGAIILGLEALSAVFFAVRSAQRAHREELEAEAKAASAFKNKMDDVSASVYADFEALKKTTVGTQERKKAIEDVNTKYKEYLPNLLTEAASLDDIAEAQLAVNRALQENIILEDDKEKRTELIKKRILALDALKDADMSAYLQTQRNSKVAAQIYEDNQFVRSLIDDVRAIEEEINALDKLKEARLNQYTGGFSEEPNEPPTKKSNDGATKTPMTEAELKKFEKFQQETLELVQKYNELKAQSVHDEAEREIADLVAKYEKEKELIEKKRVKVTATEGTPQYSAQVQRNKAADDALLAAQDSFEEQKSQIIDKWNKKRATEQMTSDLQNLEDWNAKEKLALSQKLADKEIDEKQYHARSNALQLQYLALKIRNLKDYYVDDAKIHKDLSDLEQQKSSGAITQNEYDVKKRLLEGYLEFNKGIHRQLIQAQQQYADAQVSSAKDASNKVEKELEKLLKGATAKQKQLLQTYLNEIAFMMLTGTSLTGESMQELQAKIDALMNAITLKVQEGTAAWQIALDKFLKKWMQGIQQAANSISSIWANLNRIADNNDKKRLDQIQRKVAEEEKMYDWQLNHKLISQAEHDKRVEAARLKAEKEERRAQHDAAIRQRRYSLFNAIISTAQAVAQALTVMPPWLGIALSILAGIAGGVEIAAIESEPIPPLGKGGAVVPDGPGHAEGGLKIYDPQKKQFIAETESRELHVFSREFVRKNPELTQAIMDASQNNNGEVRDQRFKATTQPVASGTGQPSSQDIPSKKQHNPGLLSKGGTVDPKDALPLMGDGGRISMQDIPSKKQHNSGVLAKGGTVHTSSSGSDDDTQREVTKHPAMPVMADGGIISLLGSRAIANKDLPKMDGGGVISAQGSRAIANVTQALAIRIVTENPNIAKFIREAAEDQKTIPNSNQQAFVPTGPRHSEGGLKLVDSRTMEVIGESESGELHIFSRSFVQKNPSLVNAIMDASQNNNGEIRDTKWMREPGKVINLPLVQQAARFEKFENGGNVVEFQPQSRSGNLQSGYELTAGITARDKETLSTLSPELIQQLSTTISELREELQYLRENGIEAFMVWNKYERALKIHEEIKSKSRINAA